MANTYTQIHIHAVFSVQNRISLISEKWRERLYQYITGIVQNNGHKMLAINGMPDHLHILFGMRPAQSLSDLMQDIKGDSSKWINSNRFVAGKFSWQEGYGAFSYSKKDLDQIIPYIMNQEEHHRSRSFITEYTSLLDEFEVDFEERYIFKAID
ncbi:MAG TPA: IS200/IS605 family transposase [Candidatus Cloacimonadota bacterium]|jgi:REP element-mobilizing transposase RayT|nr:IS200/IS605 family transposase [Candidatus Cloacimonadota bacterium]